MLDQTTRFESDLPQRKPDATRSVPFSTPISAGTFILPKLRPDTDEDSECDYDKYDQYIAPDIKSYRVFVDIDVFMKHVLHVPKNWEGLWAGTIIRIKRDPVFSLALWEYTRRCKVRGIREHIFYEPLVDVANAILEICGSSPDGTKSRTPPRYLRDDANDALPGIVKNLRPGVVTVHPKYRSKKPWNNALVDGSRIPRLKANDRDPRENHAFTPSQFPKKNDIPNIHSYEGDKVPSAPRPAPSRKRPADVLLESNRKAVKVHLGSTPGGQPPKMKPPPLQESETEQQKDAYLQVGRYIFKQFSIPTFRSHATVGLVDRDRIQFYHANHSVILVSSAVNFATSGRMEGLDKFIAIMIAFHRLSLRNDGTLHDPHDLHDGQLLGDNKKLATSEVRRGTVRFQEGNKLVLGGDENTESLTLTYGEVISRDPSLVGRATVVLHAKSSSLWKELDLVVKIGWPGLDRVAENEFLAKAVETAKSSTEDNWALKHLPRVLYAQDVTFDSDSTHERVARLFDNAEFADPKRTFIYERRTLRTIVQERLYPIEVLTDVKDIAQVLLDVACVHRWLYLRAGILHRDISLTNIMCRIVNEENEDGVTEKKVYGVLADFDLASWNKDLGKKTSQQMMGTAPFMANELLRSDESGLLHLYRHDLESFFYVMLIVASHYEIEPPTEGQDGGLRTRWDLDKLPYQEWFNQNSYTTIASLKRSTLMWHTDLNLSPTFKDFRGWLKNLKDSFNRGFWSELDYKYGQHRSWLLEGEEPKDEVMLTFDDETLGGHVSYSALINPVSKLKGKLGGLIVRYNPAPQTSVVGSTSL